MTWRETVLGFAIGGLRTGLVVCLAGSMVLLSPQVRTASAGMVTTEMVIAQATAQATRERIHALLAREELRDELRRLGVSAAAADTRVDALSDAELASIAGRLDELPAGGGVVVVALVACLIILAVLVITDATGLTDVYPWVKKPSQR